MNNYSLVIDISSDEEANKTSTPIKTLPLNMVGYLSNSSVGLEKEAREIDEEERKIRDMKAGRGRGLLQSRRYNGRPPVTIKKEIPHCHALPLSLSSRGACHDPLPVVILLAAMEYRDSAEDKGTVNTFKLY